MTRTAGEPENHQTRRAAVQARARQRQRNQRMTLFSLIVGIAIVLSVGLWWLTRDEDASAGVALYQFETPDFHSLAFDLGDEDTVYFGSHAGLQVSHDAGRTWDEGSLRDADAMQQSVALADSPRHYVAGHDVLMVSVDGGDTWQSQPNNLPSLDLHSFAGSPTDPNRLYAIPAGMGLWTSGDGGATWTETAMPTTANTQPVSLAVAPNRPERVYLARGGEIAVSDDAGMTWHASPAPEGIVYAITVAADNDETLYAGTNQGLFRRNVDRSWERMPLDASNDILALALSPAQPLRIAVVDANGNFYRSDDGGTSWDISE